MAMIAPTQGIITMNLPTLSLSGILALAGLTGIAQADRTLIHEAVIDAPIETVWHLFTTTEGARQWMAPQITIDLRPGGFIRSSYHPESNLSDEHTIINQILAYVPQRMLSIRNVQAPKGFANAELFQQTWSVMWFTSVDESHTRVRLVGLNYGEGPEWDVVYTHFEQGNAYLLNLLAQAAAKFDTDREDDSDDVKPVQRPPAGAPPIEAEVTIAAPLDDIWRAWATSEGITAFFAPQADIDLRIGGQYELYFAPDAPAGQRGSDGCSVLSYEMQRMLAFSWNAPPQFPNVRDYHTWVVLEFDQLEAGGDADEKSEQQVRVRLTHLGFAELQIAHPEHVADFERTRSYFARVWPHVLDSLKRTLESRVE
jgi:uncharacterized protein YndB with AHSA1/START domain